jgi:DNA polymerase V
MSKYIEKNIEIQHAIQNFASPEDIFWYSIDEGFVDLTSSLNYFYDKALPAEVKLDRLSKEIQLAILNQTGIYSTVGMSIGNPLLAKLALDNEAKHNSNMRAFGLMKTYPIKSGKLNP